MTTKNTFFLIIILPIFLGINACKVNYSFTGADIPAEAKTVSVGYFTSYAPLANPQVSQEFTNAMIAMLLTQTNLDVIQQEGDIKFEGSIVGYSVTPAAIQANTETAAKNRLTMRVKVIYTNSIEPEKSLEKEFSQFADFETTEDLNTVETELVEIINETLVQDIFNSTLGSW